MRLRGCTCEWWRTVSCQECDVSLSMQDGYRCKMSTTPTRLCISNRIARQECPVCPAVLSAPDYATCGPFVAGSSRSPSGQHPRQLRVGTASQLDHPVEMAHGCMSLRVCACVCLCNSSAGGLATDRLNDQLVSQRATHQVALEYVHAMRHEK